MARLIFCMTTARQRALIDDTEGTAPFALSKSRDIPDAISALENGRDVVAIADSVKTGWKAPIGTKLVMDPEMAIASLETVHQVEARIHRVQADADITPAYTEAKNPPGLPDTQPWGSLNGMRIAIAEEVFSHSAYPADIASLGEFRFDGNVLERDVRIEHESAGGSSGSTAPLLFAMEFKPDSIAIENHLGAFDPSGWWDMLDALAWDERPLPESLAIAGWLHRQEEKRAFAESDPATAVKERIASGSLCEVVAQNAWNDVGMAIFDRAEGAEPKPKQFEVHHELTVARQCFLLGLAGGLDTEAAKGATLLRMGLAGKPMDFYGDLIFAKDNEPAEALEP